MTDATMRCGGCEADEIENGTAADDENVAVAVECSLVDGIPAAFDEAEIVFAGFATGDDDGSIRQREGLRMGLAITDDVVDEIAIRVSDGFIDENENARQFVRLTELEQIANGVVSGRKDFSREQDAVRVF